MNETIRILRLDLKQTKELMLNESIKYINYLEANGNDDGYDLSFYKEMKTRSEIIESLINEITNKVFPK